MTAPIPGVPASDSPFFFDFAPAAGFTADTALMQTVATSWLELSASLAKVGMDVSQGQGHGDDFGYIDVVARVGSRFEQFVTDLTSLIVTGTKTTTAIAENLVATAHAYDAADQRSSDRTPGAGG